MNRDHPSTQRTIVDHHFTDLALSPVAELTESLFSPTMHKQRVAVRTLAHRLIESESDLEKAVAVKELIGLNTPLARKTLITALQLSPDPVVRSITAYALWQSDDIEFLSHCASSLKDDRAIDGSLSLAVSRLQDESIAVRTLVATALESFPRWRTHRDDISRIAYQIITAMDREDEEVGIRAKLLRTLHGHEFFLALREHSSTKEIAEHFFDALLKYFSNPTLGARSLCPSLITHLTKYLPPEKRFLVAPPALAEMIGDLDAKVSEESRDALIEIADLSRRALFTSPDQPILLCRLYYDIFSSDPLHWSISSEEKMGVTLTTLTGNIRGFDVHIIERVSVTSELLAPDIKRFQITTSNPEYATLEVQSAYPRGIFEEWRGRIQEAALATLESAITGNIEGFSKLILATPSNAWTRTTPLYTQNEIIELHEPNDFWTAPERVQNDTVTYRANIHGASITSSSSLIFGHKLEVTYPDGRNWSLSSMVEARAIFELIAQVRREHYGHRGSGKE